MADKCRELPRRPRGASFPVQLIPRLPSHLERRKGKKKKRPGCQTLPQRVRLVITKKREKVRFFTDISSGHHKRPLGFETAATPG